AILIGFFVLVGLLLQKKTWSQTISGTFKAIIGILIITLEADIISNAFTVFKPLWAEVLDLVYEPFIGYMGKEEFNGAFARSDHLAMAIGFLINVIMARFTRFKYIYLTGHMMFWTTTIFAGVLVQVNENISFWPLVIFLSVVMG